MAGARGARSEVNLRAVNEGESGRHGDWTHAFVVNVSTLE